MVYFICLTLSTLHISPALEVKQPYVKETVACVAYILSISCSSDRLSVYMSMPPDDEVRADLWVEQFYPPLTIKGKMNCVNTVAAPWVIFHRQRPIFWFRSGSEHGDMKLISVQSSERHCVIPQIWSSIHQQRGPLAVFIS